MHSQESSLIIVLYKAKAILLKLFHASACHHLLRQRSHQLLRRNRVISVEVVLVVGLTVPETLLCLKSPILGFSPLCGYLNGLVCLSFMLNLLILTDDLSQVKDKLLPLLLCFSQHSLKFK